MLAMLERMLQPVSPAEGREIIAEATELVRRARKPGWERRVSSDDVKPSSAPTP